MLARKGDKASVAAWPGNELTEEIAPWSKCQGWPATDPRRARCDCVASHSRDCGVGALSLQGRDPGSATCSGNAATPPQMQGVLSPESLQLSALQGSHPWQRTARHMVTLFWRWPASNGRWWQECKSLAILGHLETTLKGYSSSRAFHAINENLEPQPQLSLSLHPPLHPSPPFHGC